MIVIMVPHTHSVAYASPDAKLCCVKKMIRVSMCI